MPKKRVYHLNLRIDPDRHHALRREAGNSGLSLSAIVRLAIEGGLSDHSSQDDVRRQAQVAPGRTPRQWLAIGTRALSGPSNAFRVAHCDPINTEDPSGRGDRRLRPRRPYGSTVDQAHQEGSALGAAQGGRDRDQSRAAGRLDVGGATVGGGVVFGSLRLGLAGRSWCY